MKKEPKISLIIPTFNMAETLPATLDSALEQNYSNYEIIVVDDGSTDRTKNIVKNYQERSKKIKYIYQENKGLGGARNTGIKKASGKYFANLDADDIAKKNFLKIMMKKLKKAGPKVKAVSPNGNYLINGKKLSRTFFDNYNTSPELTIKKELKGNRIPSTGLIEIKAARELGLYQETRHREDYEFWLRLMKNGYRVKPIHKSLFYYRIHKKTLSTDIKQGAISEVNLFKKLLADKNFSKYEDIIKKRLADGYSGIAFGYLFEEKNLSQAQKYYRLSLKTHPSAKTRLLYYSFLISPSLTKLILKIKKSRSRDLKENLQV